MVRLKIRGGIHMLTYLYEIIKNDAVAILSLIISVYLLFKDRRKITVDVAETNDKKYFGFFAEMHHNPFSMYLDDKKTLSLSSGEKGYFIIKLVLSNHSNKAVTVGNILVVDENDQPFQIVDVVNVSVLNSKKLTNNFVYSWCIDKNTQTGEIESLLSEEVTLFSDNLMILEPFQSKLINYAIPVNTLDTLPEKIYCRIFTTIPRFFISKLIINVMNFIKSKVSLSKLDKFMMPRNHKFKDCLVTIRRS